MSPRSSAYLLNACVSAGTKELPSGFTVLPRGVNNRPLPTGIGSVARGVVITECLFSISCSIKCAYEQMR